MSGQPEHTGRSKAHIAIIAVAAHQAGQSMSAAVADHYGITPRAASQLIRRARNAGHPIPCRNGSTPSAVASPPANTVASRIRALGVQPGHAIDLAQHRFLTATMDRPLTQSPIARHRNTASHTEIGELL